MERPDLLIIRRMRSLLLVSLVVLPTSILAHATASSAGGRQLNSPSGAIRHVIMLQFDNVHFRRDNVPSDVEQMRNLISSWSGTGAFLPTTTPL